MKINDAPITLKIKLLHPNAVGPVKANSPDAGWDLFTPNQARCLPNRVTKIPLGIAAEIPEGYCGILMLRSGNAWKKNLVITGGVIDSTYRGEICALIHNASQSSLTIAARTKLVQLLILPVPDVVLSVISENEELSNTVRGTGGFGSTDGLCGPETGADYSGDNSSEPVNKNEVINVSPTAGRYTVKPYDTLLNGFKELMRVKLIENRGKHNGDSWLSCPVETLMAHLEEEVLELQEAINSKDIENVAREAADVANMAMMVALVYKQDDIDKVDKVDNEENTINVLELLNSNPYFMTPADGLFLLYAVHKKLVLSPNSPVIIDFSNICGMCAVPFAIFFKTLHQLYSIADIEAHCKLINLPDYAEPVVTNILRHIKLAEHNSLLEDENYDENPGPPIDED